MSAAQAALDKTLKSSDEVSGDALPNTAEKSTTQVKSQLTTLAGRFSGFESELHLTREKKKSDEDKRIILLQTQINDLQTSLELESKNRASAINALQAWLDDKMKKWQEEMQQPILQRLSSMNDRLDGLKAHLDDLDKQHQQDRITFPRLVDARMEELLNEIKDMKANFDHEVKKRDEKEKRLVNRMQEENSKLKAQHQQEKTIMEHKLMEVKRSLDEEVNLRMKGVDGLKQKLHDDMSMMRADLNKEKSDRESSDSELVQAINHYASALQDGIKIVSSQ